MDKTFQFGSSCSQEAWTWATLIYGGQDSITNQLETKTREANSSMEYSLPSPSQWKEKENKRKLVMVTSWGIPTFPAPFVMDWAMPSSNPPPQNSPHTKILSLGALRSMSLSGDGSFTKGVNAWGYWAGHWIVIIRANLCTDTEVRCQVITWEDETGQWSVLCLVCTGL